MLLRRLLKNKWTLYLVRSLWVLIGIAVFLSVLFVAWVFIPPFNAIPYRVVPIESGDPNDVIVPSNLSNTGDVTGTRSLHDPAGELVHQAFLWSEREGLRDLGTLGGKESQGYNLNDHGWIVGESDTPSGQKHAFLWRSDNGMQDLGTLGGEHSWATAVNNQGQAVGTSSIQGGTHAFIWDATQGLRDLGTPAGATSSAYDINDLGDVVGTTWIPGASKEAVMWTAQGEMKPIASWKGFDTRPMYINNRGMVAGEITQMSPGFNRFGGREILRKGGFVWDATHGARGIWRNTSMTSVRGLNNRGQVVGRSQPQWKANLSSMMADTLMNSPIGDAPEWIQTGTQLFSEAVSRKLDGFFLFENESMRSLYNHMSLKGVTYNPSPLAINDNGQLVVIGGVINGNFGAHLLTPELSLQEQ